VIQFSIIFQLRLDLASIVILQCVATRVPREIVEYINKYAAACENFKCPSTYRAKFSWTVDNAGVTSEL